jgi:hypothetical protein
MHESNIAIRSDEGHEIHIPSVNRFGSNNQSKTLTEALSESESHLSPSIPRRHLDSLMSMDQIKESPEVLFSPSKIKTTITPQKY